MMFSTTMLSCMLSFASPQELLQSAQTQLNSQQWEAAAATLDELITIIKEPAAEINYDRGIAHYNLEQYNQAAKAFEEAMSSADDPILASFCAYNFGNAVYQSTMRDLEGTTNEANQEEAIKALEDAKTQLKKTIDSYRRAIANNTDDMDPRANGELAWKMLQQLDAMQEQMKQQQQQQQQDDQNQEQQQDEESAEEQADNQQNKEQGDSDKEKQGEQQDGEQSDSKDLQSSEDQVGEQPKDKQQSDAAQPSDKQEEGEQSQQKQDGEESESQDQQSSEDQQQQDTEQSQQQSEEKQNGSEDSPSEQETPNFEEGDLESSNEEGNNEPVESMDMKEEGERLSKSEASRLLQLIRDKEQQRRKLLAARRAARRVPVHKDW